MLELTESYYTILPKFCMITRSLATTASSFKPPQKLPSYPIYQIKWQQYLLGVTNFIYHYIQYTQFIFISKKINIRNKWMQTCIAHVENSMFYLLCSTLGIGFI